MTTATLCDPCVNAQVPRSGRIRALTTALAAWWQAGVQLLAPSDPDERFLAASTSHGDFARRERILELQHEVRLSRLRAGLWETL